MTPTDIRAPTAAYTGEIPPYNIDAVFVNSFYWICNISYAFGHFLLIDCPVSVRKNLARERKAEGEKHGGKIDRVKPVHQLVQGQSLYDRTHLKISLPMT